MMCPRCQRVLVRETRGDVPVDACRSCGGTWFDRGELEAELARHPSSEAPPAPAGKPPPPRWLRCPVCDTPMTPRNYERFSGVVLDFCTAHGVWADAGEVERARAFLAAGGRERRARKEAEERRLAASVERATRRDVSARGEATSVWMDVALFLGLP